jgi:hypothetical protein
VTTINTANMSGRFVADARTGVRVDALAVVATVHRY